MRIALCAALWLLVPSTGAADDPAAPPVAGADGCLESAVSAIQVRYEAIRDLRADFVQTTRSVTIGGAGASSTGRGTVQLAKPGKMRWSYTQPEPSLVVSDGETLWIYDPGRGEAQRLPVGEGFLSQAAIQFLVGEGDIRRDFEVAVLSCEDEAVELELTPRRPASYEKLELRADRASGELLRTRVFDLLGNVTSVDFANVRANLDLPAEAFRFEVPEGVEVIEITTP